MHLEIYDLLTNALEKSIEGQRTGYLESDLLRVEIWEENFEIWLNHLASVYIPLLDNLCTYIHTYV